MSLNFIVISKLIVLYIVYITYQLYYIYNYIVYVLSILSQYFRFYNLDALSFPFSYILRKNVQNFEIKKCIKIVIFKVILCNFVWFLRNFENKCSKFIDKIDWILDIGYEKQRNASKSSSRKVSKSF